MIGNPLIEELKKLRDSSKFAVAQGTQENLNPFKKYLHIKREVEKELQSLIVNLSNTNKSQLILVCGNVGDGKSHVLSHLHAEIKDSIKLFTIHNDATESHNPNESSNETLYKLLDGFKDENLKTSTDKIILAINLGTLSKFIEEYKSEFKTFKSYVSDNKILDTDIIHHDDFDEESNFHHVNFTDYHLYSLTENGAVSEIITSLFEKIVAKNESNSIYKAYKDYKKKLDHETICPVIYNYEFLFDQNNRKIIIDLIIKSIITTKEIVSLRTLLNFIYDIIVPVDIIEMSEEEYVQKISKMSGDKFISNLLPNYIFEHSELSSLFEKIEKLDPCLNRDASTDEVLLSLINAIHPIQLFKEHINNDYINTIENRLEKGKIKKNALSRFYIRLNYFSNYYKTNTLRDLDYDEYLVWLYYFNVNNIDYIQKVYELVLNAVRVWNGDAKTNDKVIINVGKKQTKYRVFKDFNPIPDVNNLKPKNYPIRLHKFTQEFSLSFKINGEKSSLRINVDFSLFKIIKMVCKGYRPNKKDNNNYVYFVNAITILTNQNNQKSSLYIDEINIGNPVDYQFSKNHFGGYTFKAL